MRAFQTLPTFNVGGKIFAEHTAQDVYKGRNYKIKVLRSFFIFKELTHKVSALVMTLAGS